MNYENFEKGWAIGAAIFLAIQTIVRITPTKNDDKKLAEIQGKSNKILSIVKMIFQGFKKK